MSTNASPVPRLVGDVITRVIRKKAAEAKKPSTDGAVSVSEFLDCSLKPRLRKEHPGIQDESIGTADGFILECEVYETILELFGDKVVFRKHTFPYVSSHGLRVEGYCDLAIIGRNKLVIIQISSAGESPHTIPGDTLLEEFVIHDQELLKRISFDQSLIEQARIQRYIAQSAVPDMEVEHYLLQKTALKFPGGTKRVFLLRKTSETISYVELEDLIGRHLQVAGPKQAFECAYCHFKTKGVCDGQEADSVRSTMRSLEGLKPEVQEAIEQYICLYNQMLTLEEFLKPSLMDGFFKGDFVEMNVEGKKVKFGWFMRVSYVWDFLKLFKLLGNELFKYLQVSFWSLNELEARVSSMTDLARVRHTKRENKWKGLV